MKEHEVIFKGLNTGLRRLATSPRNTHALVECYNIIPDEVGLKAYEPVIGLGESADWGGSGVYVRPDEVKDITIYARDYLDSDQIVGASVLIDGVFKGLTGEDGSLTVASVAVGGHTIQISADGYVSTATDSLQNDYFIVT